MNNGLSELLLLTTVGRGGMGTRTTNGKIQIRHKTYISAWKHPQLMIRGYQVQFVVVGLLFYVHGKRLRSCRDGQLT